MSVVFPAPEGAEMTKRMPERWMSRLLNVGELFADAVEFADVMGTGVAMTFGRQDFRLGNGFLIGDGDDVLEVALAGLRRDVGLAKRPKPRHDDVLAHLVDEPSNGVDVGRHDFYATRRRAGGAGETAGGP